MELNEAPDGALPGDRRSRGPVLYPLLASIHSVVALASLYVSELTSPPELIRPLLLSLAFWAGAWLLAGRWSRDPDRRALLCLLLVWLLGYSGLLAHAVQTGTELSRWAADLATLAAGGTVVLAAAYLVRRHLPRLNRLTQWLNLTFGLVLALTAFPALGRRSGPLPEPLPLPAEVPGFPAGSAEEALPDIYLVILDGYTGATSLRENFHFDNGDFETFLRGRGFYVPERARANYVHTFLALGAMLNWTHLDPLTTQQGTGTPDWGVAYQLIEHNRTWRFLERQGYRFVFFPTALAVIARNRYADLQIPSPGSIRTELETRLYQITILPLFRDGFWALESARLMDWKLEQLANCRLPRDRSSFSHTCSCPTTPTSTTPNANTASRNGHQASSAPGTRGSRRPTSRSCDASTARWRVWSSSSSRARGALASLSSSERPLWIESSAPGGSRRCPSAGAPTPLRPTFPAAIRFPSTLPSAR